MRNLFVLIISIFVGACSTPNSKFPEFEQRAQDLKEIDVLLDIVLGSDIPGSSIGIDIEQHREAIEDARYEINDILVEKGYVVKSFHVNGGLFIDWEGLKELEKQNKAAAERKAARKVGRKANDDSEGTPGEGANSAGPIIVYSKSGMGTGEAVTGPFIDSKAKPWNDPEVRDYLIGAQNRAIEYIKPASNQQQSTKPSLDIEDIPEALKTNSSGILLVIRVMSMDVHDGKSFGVGAVTGLLTLVATGGALMVVTAPVDSNLTDAIVIDTQASKILWYNSGSLQGSSATNFDVGRLLVPLSETSAAIDYKIDSDPEVKEEQVVTEIYDLSGTYQSEIIIDSGTGLPLIPPTHLRTTMTIVQTGNQFKGRFGSGGIAEGEVDGGKAKFDWFVLYDEKGEWEIDPDTNTLSGNWISTSSDYKGRWKLIKTDGPMKKTEYLKTVVVSSGESVESISGTYVSSISSSYQGLFSSSREKKMRLVFREEGGKIIAENKELNLTLVGTRSGNTIKFYSLPDNKISKFEINGEWTVMSKSGRMVGEWKMIRNSRPENGVWNLRKIE